MRRAGITDPPLRDGGVRMDTSAEPEPVRYGDIVLIYIDERRRYIVRVEEGRVFGSDKGILRLDELVGRPYGSRVKLSTGVEALVLRPLLDDLLSLAYRRRSQVIYPKDLGFIIYIADIAPGKRVLEAGIGSGFLASAVASRLRPGGRLYSYEIREDMAEIARQNLKLAGLLDVVEIKVADVRSGVEEKSLDACLLDMPDPWNALNTAYNALKPSARLVVFVPTVNQVEKTVVALRRHGGFTDIHAVELLLREYQVKEGSVRPSTRMIGHTGYIVYARRV